MRTLLQILFYFLLVTQYCFAQWYQQNCDTTALLESVFFLDEFTGWTVGHQCCGPEASIFYTEDGGTTWTSKTHGLTNWLYDVCFSDLNTGWIVGAGGLILHTSDRGANWNTQTSGVMYTLIDVDFVDSNTGWIVGGDGFVGRTILHTTNAGSTWSIQLNDTTNPRVQFTGVSFVDVNTGWVIGGLGKLVHTTNSGISWINQATNTTLWLWDVYFVDPYNGWAVGDSGLILHTTNGGIDWYTQTSTTSSHLRPVYFFNTEVGWVGGSDILNTSDGGTTWVNQVTNSLYGFSDIYFVDANTGWAVGHFGTIYHTTNGGGVSFVDYTTIQPTTFILEQNYPNPFNPNTTFKYSIPNESEVIIKVFDILGNEIETIVNEEKQVGTYELNWNAANLPSGVYFYQLRAGNFVETKKMILLK